MTTQTPELIQRARDIVADAYIACEVGRPLNNTFPTHAARGAHIDSYTQYLREGAYDSDLAVQATLVALTSASQMTLPAPLTDAEHDAILTSIHEGIAADERADAYEEADYRYEQMRDQRMMDAWEAGR